MPFGGRGIGGSWRGGRGGWTPTSRQGQGCCKGGGQEGGAARLASQSQPSSAPSRSPSFPLPPLPPQITHLTLFGIQPPTPQCPSPSPSSPGPQPTPTPPLPTPTPTHPTRVCIIKSSSGPTPYLHPAPCLDPSPRPPPQTPSFIPPPPRPHLSLASKLNPPVPSPPFLMTVSMISVASRGSVRNWSVSQPT